ncbi:hypothetical protein QFC20_000517 [Naganishia adeliensis]|uniref:Uncharacterized protein n=1 Tax=Naganishia adeliensis TaxID=92952 RepID=A0ACC2WZJ4_9TREE|nr:hypothetical protein QFC20_000517 [Naganishia adeliensis]
MNSPPGFVPPRPRRHVHHQVAPIVVPPRMHPRQMLRTNQRGPNAVPVPTPHYSHPGQQPFLDPNMRHPFRSPMMPFMPYPVPMGMFVPPHGFGRAMPMMPMPLHPQTQQVHHVHHHHYHYAAHHFDTSPSTSERAFPSREAWQRHGRPDPSPQVFDPDGYPLGNTNDGGPDVVDVEDASRSGMVMVVRDGERHQSARYFAARAAEQECKGETRRGLGDAAGEQRMSSPVSNAHGMQSMSRMQDEETDENTKDDDSTPEITPTLSNQDRTSHSAATAGSGDADGPDGHHVDEVVRGGGSACAQAAQDVTPRRAQSLWERQMSPPVESPLQDKQRARSLHSRAIPTIPAKTTGEVIHPLGPGTPRLNTASSAATTSQSPSAQIPPDAMNTAVDRLLDTTGLSARQFMQMLDDRAFVLDVERYKEVRGGPDGKGR